MVPQNGYKNIDVDNFKKIAHNKNIIILDVRTDEEVKSGIIKNALHINFYDADFDKKVSRLDKSKAVYVYCKVGSRSTQAADKLVKAGFSNVYNINGGMDAWKEKNYPTVSKK